MSKGRWYNFRQAILKERNEKCEHCGKTLAELRLEFPRCQNQLQVAHIKSVLTFPKLRFERSNVELLCQACHEKADPWHERMLRAGRLPKSVCEKLLTK